MPSDFCNTTYCNFPFFLSFFFFGGGSNVDTRLQINGYSHPDSFGRNNKFSCQPREERGSEIQKGWETFYNISNMSNDISVCTLKSTGDT